MAQDEEQVVRTPTEHPLQIVENVTDQVYKTEANRFVEQSAVYSKVPFGALDNEECHGIVLTAQCDIEDYASSNYVLLARVAPIGEIFGHWLLTKNRYSEAEILGEVPVGDNKPQRKSVCHEFVSKYLNNKTFQYYFLPALADSLPPSFACFEITQCMRIGQIEQLEKVCVLRSPFREAVPSYYSACIGRVGTPVFTKEYLRQTLDAICRIQ